MVERPDDGMTASQRAAVDPAASAWVGASAGSGKTHVLTSRILRLLLIGVPPHRILCLTYTRAAAAEMANRLGRSLARWTVGDAEDVAKVLGGAPSGDELARAKRLFAAVTDAPDGLRIETIHGFCQSLLARFPLEAGVAPHFHVVEDRTVEELLAEARERTLAAAEKDKKLAKALDIVSRHADDVAFGELIDALVRERRRLAESLTAGGVEATVARIWGIFGFTKAATSESVVAEASADKAFDKAALKAAASALAGGSPADAERGASILTWIGKAKRARETAFDDYAKIYLTSEGTVRKTLATKKVVEKNPEALAALSREAERIAAQSARRDASVVAEASAALVTLGARVLDEFAAIKRRLAVLDYDDLILAARRLLERPGISPWVLYKLDGIDHVLVDEAQDTSPDQWAILRALTGEFFAGQGVRDAARTVFAVGDPKQSIFSFQGADPAGFARSRDDFQEAARAAGAPFVPVQLHTSFRSTAPVLKAVDEVFAQPAAKAGVDPDETAIVHSPRRIGMAGRVEVWPPVEAAPSEPPAAWAPPVDVRTAADPQAILANDIATRIRGWIGTEILPARGRTVRPGDVMVLVRRRGPFVDALVKRLKQLNVPVAGADRMVLIEQLPMRDVLSLIRFLLQPADNLSLAETLKSPLFGFDDAALETVAVERGEATLWQSLQARRSGDAATARLKALLARADFVAPYEFLTDILVADGGRKRFAARLGEQSGDPLDELMGLALDFERDHAPSLEGFVAWLESSEAEVKRDLEQGRDEVRVMTIHGAKGLQAPIVILPDTCQIPKARESVLWRDGAPIWTVNKEFEEPTVAAMKEERKERTLAEYRRLLYVAMTRAEDRLYVGGWDGKKTRSAGNWYDLISTALPAPIECPQDGPPKSDGETAEAAERAAPSWADRPPPAEPAPPKPLAPSRIGVEPPARSPFDPEDEARFVRGRLVHRLLETLPGIDPASRRAAGERFLDRAAPGLAPEARAALLAETLAVLDHPDARALFAPGSKAEVSVAGLVGAFVVGGQIDRIAVGEAEISIVDYKTNRDPPTRIEDAAPAYLAQLAAYRACLRAIYPGRRVRCHLLWTVGPRMMEAPEKMLDAHAPGP